MNDVLQEDHALALQSFEAETSAFQRKVEDAHVRESALHDKLREMESAKHGSDLRVLQRFMHELSWKF